MFGPHATPDCVHTSADAISQRGNSLTHFPHASPDCFLLHIYFSSILTGSSSVSKPKTSYAIGLIQLKREEGASGSGPFAGVSGELRLVPLDSCLQLRPDFSQMDEEANQASGAGGAAGGAAGSAAGGAAGGAAGAPAVDNAKVTLTPPLTPPLPPPPTPPHPPPPPTPTPHPPSLVSRRTRARRRRHSRRSSKEPRPKRSLRRDACPTHTSRSSKRPSRGVT